LAQHDSKAAPDAGLLRSGAGIAIVMGWNRLVLLLLSVVLARFLGASGVGVYALAFSVLGVLTLVAELGFPVLVEREIAAAGISARWSLVRGLLNLVLSAQIVAGVALALVVIVATRPLQHSDIWLLVALMIPCMSLFRVGCHTLSGLHRVFLARLLEHGIRPTLVLVVVAALFWTNAAYQTPAMALLVQFVVLVAVLLGVVVVLRRVLPSELSQARPVYTPGPWLKSGATLAFGLGAVTVNTQFDILVLSAFYPMSEVGLYRMAVQGSSLVGFGMVVAGMWLTPQFAKLWAEKNMTSLQLLVTRTTRGIALTALSGALVLGLFGRELLELLFGIEFIASYQPMVLLLFTHVIAGLVGAVGPLLNMTGHEAVGARAIGAGAVVNLILNLILVPQFGMMGAASATLVAAVVWCSLISIGIFRHTGVRPTVLG